MNVAPRSPLSSAQRRLWFAHHVSDPAALTVALTYEIDGEIDAGLLERALRYVVDRHHLLCSRFSAAGPEPVRVVGPPDGLRLGVTDLRADPDPVGRARRLARELVGRGFDLATGPVLRAWLLRTAPARQVLIIAVHRIAFDEQSRAILAEELEAAYTALAAGREPALPVPASYARYVDAERDRLSDPRSAADLAYWRDRLGDAPRLLGLPLDRPRPPEPSLGAGEVTFEIPGDIAGRLEALAGQVGATLFDIGLAAYQALLARYCGTADVVVGVPVGGRPPEWRHTIGLFTQTAAIRTEIAGDPTVHDLVRQVRDEVRAAAWHPAPFDRIVAALGLDRDLSRHPVFQVWFEVVDEPGPVRLGTAEARPFDIGADLALLDLSLRVTRGRDGAATGRFGYATDLFDRGTIERLADHYLNLLFSAARAPGRRLSAAGIYLDDEWDRLVHGFNDTAVPPPAHPTIAAWFEHQVARAPAATALVAGARRMSYSELNANANRLAHHLREGGVGPGTVVGLCLPREADMVAALLAVLKAGAAYTPVDPDHPANRIAYCLRDAGARLVLTTSTLAGRLPPNGPPTVALDEIRPRLADRPAVNPPASGTADDLAYVIYTSGSTGTPKGVAMPQRPLLNLFAWQLRWAAGPGATWQFAALSFDPSVKEIFGTLLAGQTLVVVDEGRRTDPGELLDLLVRERVRRLLFCPPMVLEILALAALAAPEVPPLREVTTGGDRLQLTATTKLWLDRLPGVSLTNGYGVTETHLVTAARLTGRAGNWPEYPPMGRPLSNVRVYLLDRYLMPVPVGATGEIFVGGAGVSWGYLNRPAATAERFLPDPFVNVPGARMYRSGDLARRRPDGTLDFLGRADLQVKVHGHRIEPAEIEAALLGYGPEVRAALVVPVDRDGEVRLAAYVVPAGGTGPDPARLRTHLRTVLPAHLIPGYLTVLPELPMTPRGKIDRTRLPAPAVPTGPGPRPAGLTPRQALVARVFRDALGVDRIGADDNFFTLGGHSLLALAVTGALSRASGVPLPARTLFRHQTVRELAALLPGDRTRIEELDREAVP